MCAIFGKATILALRTTKRFTSGRMGVCASNSPIRQNGLGWRSSCRKSPTPVELARTVSTCGARSIPSSWRHGTAHGPAVSAASPRSSFARTRSRAALAAAECHTSPSEVISPKSTITLTHSAVLLFGLCLSTFRVLLTFLNPYALFYLKPQSFVGRCCS